MCFYGEYDIVLVDNFIGTARKKSACCCECGDGLAGQPAQILVFRDSFNGVLDTQYECSRCFIVREFIYRHERREGCSSGQSVAPYGSRQMQDWFEDRAWNETWRHAWPKTVDEAVTLRDSVPAADDEAVMFWNSQRVEPEVSLPDGNG